jgi:hypothetical protein
LRWFDLDWWRDWCPVPPKPKPIPSDLAIRRRARKIERTLGVKFLGKNPKTNLAAVIFLMLPVLRSLLESAGLTISDELWANALSLLAGLGFGVARDGNQTAPAPPPVVVVEAKADPAA